MKEKNGKGIMSDIVNTGKRIHVSFDFQILLVSQKPRTGWKSFCLASLARHIQRNLHQVCKCQPLISQWNFTIVRPPGFYPINWSHWLDFVSRMRLAWEYFLPTSCLNDVNPHIKSIRALLEKMNNLQGCMLSMQLDIA